LDPSDHSSVLTLPICWYKQEVAMAALRDVQVMARREKPCNFNEWPSGDIAACTLWRYVCISPMEWCVECVGLCTTRPAVWMWPHVRECGHERQVSERSVAATSPPSSSSGADNCMHGHIQPTGVDWHGDPQNSALRNRTAYLQCTGLHDSEMASISGGQETDGESG